MDAAPVLRAARSRARLTQAAVAERAGTSQATVSAYESGRKQPSLETLSRLLAATGSRLAVKTGERPVIEPSRVQLANAGAGLLEVLELAEALPVRHGPELRFPTLRRRRRA